MMFSFLSNSFPQFGVKDSATRLFHFVAYSFVFTWLLLLIFLSFGSGEISAAGVLYSLTIPLYYYVGFLIIITLLLPVLLLRHCSMFIVIPKVIFDTVLIADFFLFGVYRFHVDMMLINMLIHDFSGIGFSAGLLLLSSVVFIIVTAVNIVIYRVSSCWRKFPLIKANILLLTIFIGGQLIHAVGYEYRQVAITKFTPYFPYYAPLTSSKLMAKLKQSMPDVFPETAETGTGRLAGILGEQYKGLISYPAKPMACDNTPLTDLPNILIFVAESWRQDAMNEKVTPNISNFTKSATQFTNHYSGGNVTVNGLFSLMYGLHPTYRDLMSSEPFKNQSLLTKILSQKGYEVDVYTSSNLDRFSLKPMFFGEIDDANYINPQDESNLINDRVAVTQLLSDLQEVKINKANSKPRKPWFKFVFLSSSHHNYQYPKTSEKFNPVETNPEQFLFDKHMDPGPLLNRYKNSVHYIDSMFGQIWQTLDEIDAAENTFTVVTSDHGEEFNDNKQGYWGHGNNFTQVQLAVPLIVKQAGNNKHSKVDTLTGHVDVVPTILSSIAKCSNNVTDYSNGYDLFTLPQYREGIIAASYLDKAFLFDNYVYATGLMVDSYHVSDITNKNENFDYVRLSKLKQQGAHLLKN